MVFPALRRLGGASVALAAALLGGCSYEPTTDLPDGAVSFTAPTEYASWWSRTEQCSELAGSMAKVRWHVVPGVASFPTDQGEKVGIRIKTGDRVDIVLAGDFQMHEMVVRHEMLHALLNEPGHPDLYFTERCRLTWATWQSDGGDASSSTLATTLN